MVEPAATSWDLAEPLCEGAPFYSDVLKADLHPGTFVLLVGTSSGMPTSSMTRSLNAMEDGTEVVARIVALVSTNPSSVSVNIFRFLKEVQQTTEGLLNPDVLNENHLRHLAEIVQTTELRVVPTRDVVNLSFVFTIASLQDPSSLFFTCQGMIMAFLLRFRFDPAASPRSVLTEVPEGYCLPFPSNYQKSRYHDCFAHRVWNNLISIKMEIMRLLGRYSQQQGLFGRERGRLTNITSETWGFLDRQFSHIFGDSGCGSSSRVRVYRVTESGLVIKAARVRKVCSVMRFETKTHLRHLSKIFGESVTAGQRCRLPRVSSPKTLWKNDIINVVCGSDDCESEFNPMTIRDGIDLEFDGTCELFITIRYRRYAYSGSLDGCDPLLASLICRRSIYSTTHLNEQEEGDEDSSNEGEDMDMEIMAGSEFMDADGCLYRVIKLDSNNVHGKCVYPRQNNDLYGNEKLFDIRLTKELIQQRING